MRQADFMESWLERAVGAATDVAREEGIASDAPAVVAYTNNVVIRLDPSPVVAKVGPWPHSEQVLRREHSIARALIGRGAPVAAPVPGIGPLVHSESGYTVTLWELLEAVPEEADDAEIAASLHGLHHAMDGLGEEVPSYWWALDHAAQTLASDRAMRHIGQADLGFLRHAFAVLTELLRDRPLEARLLHGEPHSNNMIVTQAGIRWIDLEAVCRGPLEYDLSACRSGVSHHYGQVDEELLLTMRQMTSARVAVWCWAGASFPEMRHHGEHHLSILRESLKSGPRP